MKQFSAILMRLPWDTTFFLYLPYTVPHDDYQIPDTAPYTQEDWPQNAKVHAAMITRLDRDVGKIMDLLKSQQLDEHTMVLFCSDNGAAQLWEGIFDSSGILRGRKRDVYEGGIRTPMLVTMPGTVPAGVTSNFPWYFADVLPTLASISQLELFRTEESRTEESRTEESRTEESRTESSRTESSQAAWQQAIDGISVLSAILEGKQTVEDRYMYWEFHEAGFQQAVRWNHWKAVRQALDKPLELYDLSVDVSEQFDVVTLHPNITKQMEEYLKNARSDSRYWPDSMLGK